MHAAFLVGYLALLAIILWRSRSVAWAMLVLAASLSVAGLLVGFVIGLGRLWTFTELQVVLLLTLLVAAVVAWLRPASLAPRRRQLLGTLLPAGLLILFVLLVTTVLTARPAFLTPVGFLIGHANAEDNAKWLDFTSHLASGLPIDQALPTGGPLQLFLVFVATCMAVVSQVAFGGVNEVAVAANTVVYGELLLACLAPLALAPLVETRLPRVGRIPVAAIWTGALALVAASFVATGYGHMTLQFVFIIVGLWAASSLAGLPIRRAGILAAIALAAAGTVWLPLNALALVVVVGWLVVLVLRPIRQGRSQLDLPSIVLMLVVAVMLFEPIRSSIAFTLGTPYTSAEGSGGAARGVTAAIPALFGEGSLFSSPGGTDQLTAIQGVIAVAALLGATAVLSPVRHAGRRFIPVLLLVGMAVGIAILDFWVTGTGPGYGSKKFAFMTGIVVIAVCTPIGLMRLDWPRRGMTLVRWAGVGAIVALLVVDTLVPRGAAAVRPEQWSPAIPFNNPAGYWAPAEVNGTANQPVAMSPLGCVYLPKGAAQPSAILDSQLSDAQRVYSCSRILAGLSGADFFGQAYVDWMRREWLTNTRAWNDVRGYLENMPDWVRRKPVIILDDGSNVIGLESVDSLLQRFPVQPQ